MSESQRYYGAHLNDTSACIVMFEAQLGGKLIGVSVGTYLKPDLMDYSLTVIHSSHQEQGIGKELLTRKLLDARSKHATVHIIVNALHHTSMHMIASAIYQVKDKGGFPDVIVDVHKISGKYFLEACEKMLHWRA